MEYKRGMSVVVLEPYNKMHNKKQQQASILPQDKNSRVVV